jgi:D-inositol-3-phosphate glycosyltransferase
MKKRVALITHEMSLVGGLATLMTFLYGTLAASGRYEPELISLATSASDSSSLRLKSPKTWFRGPKIERVAWHDLFFTHVGVWGSELEFQRYRPRLMLTELLKSYDLLQFIVGSPPWACTANDTGRPVLIWTATTTRADRASQRRGASAARRAWSSLMMPITENYERRALKRAQAIFALSEYTGSTIKPIAGAERVILAPCGVDTTVFRPAVKPVGDYIICVGRLSDPRKNVRLLLEAYDKLHQTRIDLPDLYLVGESPSQSDLSFLRSRKLEHKIQLRKPGQEELSRLYRNARFCVLSSNEEGLGIVILEAMASGLPVISTDCGGPATAIIEGRTGLLTPVGDVNALAGAMEKLLRDPALRMRMGKEGRRVAEERFSLSAAGKIFLDTYDNVLGVEKVQSERPASHEPAFSTIGSPV